MSAPFVLAIGNKRYSSWSLRPWLILKHLGVPFEEVVIPLRAPASDDLKRRYCPSGRVPTLHHGSNVVWESLAIAEYLAEVFPEAGLWPDDPADRAFARSISHEMHAGFTGLRQNMPCNVAVDFPEMPRTPEAERDIARIEAIWSEARARHAADGPFLFGRFGIADAMYAPVTIRFRAYGVKPAGEAGRYVETMLGLAAMTEWIAAGRAESWRIEVYEPPFKGR
jgi:glutathione S-transferase